MKIQGKLTVKKDTQNVSATFQKREFVIEYSENPEYPQFIKFELTKDRVDLIENAQVGDLMNVEFNLRGRKWTNPQGEEVYFNSLEAWKINKGPFIDAVDDLPFREGIQGSPPTEKEDDLPF